MTIDEAMELLALECARRSLRRPPHGEPYVDEVEYGRRMRAIRSSLMDLEGVLFRRVASQAVAEARG